MNQITFTVTILMLVGSTACNKRELKNSEYSIKAVAQKVLDAVQDNDENALQELRITEPEFKKILWPDLPARKNNVPYSFAWNSLNANSTEAIAKLLQNYGGRSFELQSVKFNDSIGTYGNSKVHPGSILVVKDHSGSVREIRLFGSILEHNGEYKVIGYVN